jgi:hypothetical protein
MRLDFRPDPSYQSRGSSHALFPLPIAGVAGDIGDIRCGGHAIPIRVNANNSLDVGEAAVQIGPAPAGDMPTAATTRCSSIAPASCRLRRALRPAKDYSI